MSVLGGFNFTTFSGVNLKNTAAIRIVGDGGFASTLSMRIGQEANRELILPDKNGTLPIMGTFAIQLPAIAATTSIQSTIATVSGIRVEDALSVIVNGGTSAGYGAINDATSGATSRILLQALPGNGQITLTFANFGVATGYVQYVCSYLAMR